MSVPDTDNFDFIDICKELYGYDAPGMTLDNAFTDADPFQFDSRYGNPTAPNDMLEFRNYGAKLMITLDEVQKVYYSNDATNFTAITSFPSLGFSYSIRDMLYANGKWFFLTSSDSNQNCYILSSPDLSTWNIINVSLKFSELHTIEFTGSIFYVGGKGSNTAGAVMMASYDGERWVAIFQPGSLYTIRSIAWNDTYAVGVGDYAGNGYFVRIRHSDFYPWSGNPGFTGSGATGALSGFHDVTYGNGLFVAGAAAGNSYLFTSPDGYTWTDRGKLSIDFPGNQTAIDTYIGIYGVKYYAGYGSVFALVGRSSGGSYPGTYKSFDGLNWTSIVNQGLVKSLVPYNSTFYTVVSTPSILTYLGLSITTNLPSASNENIKLRGITTAPNLTTIFASIQGTVTTAGATSYTVQWRLSLNGTPQSNTAITVYLNDSSGATYDETWNATIVAGTREVTISRTYNRSTSANFTVTATITSVPAGITKGTYVDSDVVTIPYYTPITISASPNPMFFLLDFDAQTLNITCSTTWQVISLPSWATVNTSSGSGNASITVSTQKLTASTSGTLVLQAGGSVNYNVTLAKG